MSSELEVLDWSPTDGQRMAKARFYNSVSTSFRALDSYSREEIAQLAGVPAVTKWLQNADFTRWFFNGDLARQQLMAHAESAVEELVNVLKTPLGDPRSGKVSASAKLRAAELVLQYAGMTPAQRVENINVFESMPADQLRDYLASNVRALLKQLPSEQVREIIGEQQNNDERALLTNGAEGGDATDGPETA